MVVTILVSNGSFHAVEYNQQKVSQGSAELLEMKNFGYLEKADEFTASDLQHYLIDYSCRNTRIRKPQFHVAISCKQDEYSFEELQDIGHQYLHEMGYDNDGQPLLIYGHHDTDNNHIHIITSRVAPDGHKIDHSHEKKRSISVMNRIMGVDEHARLSEVVTKAMGYRFSSVSQFKAILECQGYSCEESGSLLKIRRGGEVVDSVKLKTIEKQQRNWKPGIGTRKRVKALLTKYRDISTSKENLDEQMHRYFGISLVFLGKADSPYGYMIVDHKNKTVLKGSEVLPIKQLMHFTSAEEKFRDIDKAISSLMEDHPNLTSRELTVMLSRQYHAVLTREGIKWGEQVHILDDEVRSRLKENDKISWLQSFHPSSEVECAILYRYGKMGKLHGLEAESPNERKIQKSVDLVKGILKKANRSNLKDKFFESGIRIYRLEGKFYCIDVQNQAIFCMNDQKLNMNLMDKVYSWETHSKEHKLPTAKTSSSSSSVLPNVGRGVTSLLSKSGGSGSENRENEVGSRSNYDQIDDERTLKR